MQDEGDLHALPTLSAYVPVTRRKFLHGVYLPDGRNPFTSQRLTDCMAWLDDNGWSVYRLISDRGTFIVHASRDRK